MTAYDAITRVLPLRAVIDVKGRRDDVAPRLRRVGLAVPEPGRLSSAGALDVLQAGPAHWMLLAPLHEEERLLQELLAQSPAADTLILAVSDAYQFLALQGPQARELLAIASPMDLAPVAFLTGSATFTEAFGQKALLLLRESGFELAFERSYSPMVQDYLSRINPGADDGRQCGN